jgi:hypothetical protein
MFLSHCTLNCNLHVAIFFHHNMHHAIGLFTTIYLPCVLERLSSKWMGVWVPQNLSNWKYIEVQIVEKFATINHTL